MGMTEEKGKQSNKTGLVLDDGRIESIKDFVSPEQLYQNCSSVCTNIIRLPIFR